MVEKIISHFMPSVEDSLNTTPAREGYRFPNRDHGLGAASQQFYAIGWRTCLNQLSFKLTLILPVVDLLRSSRCVTMFA